MKNGMTHQDFTKEVYRQAKTKRDFVLPINKVKVYSEAEAVRVAWQLEKGKEFEGGLSKNGHEQVAQFCGIPMKYYEMMKGHPGLLANNIGHWLNLSSDRRLIRTLDGNIRALLSDSYRRLDNFDVAQVVLPLINEVGAELVSCNVTESKLYMKVVTSKVQDEVKTKKDVGEVVWAGFEVENSEVGKGSFKVSPMAYILSCKNGNMYPEYGLRKYHTGSEIETNQIEFANDTKMAEDKAFFLRVRDIVKHALSHTTFDKIIKEMRRSTGLVIEEPQKVIELVSEKYQFNQDEQENILKFLMEGGDMTSWGLGNAVTRMAQDVESYDRSTELEHIGPAIMRQSWN